MRLWQSVQGRTKREEEEEEEEEDEEDEEEEEGKMLVLGVWCVCAFKKKPRSRSSKKKATLLARSICKTFLCYAATTNKAYILRREFGLTSSGPMNSDHFWFESRNCLKKLDLGMVDAWSRIALAQLRTRPLATTRFTRSSGLSRVVGGQTTGLSSLSVN